MTEQRTPLFVRLPQIQAARLDRAAFELKASKQEIVSRLIAGHLDDEVKRVAVEVPDEGLAIGHHAFTPAPPRPVLTLAGLAERLQIDEDDARALAEAGEVP